VSKNSLEKIRPDKQQEFTALKDEAWAIKKQANGTITHAQVLDRLAVARGFKNWSMLALNWRADA
jgi:hypothetical protein